MGSRLNILFIFIVSVIIGVPVWWKSTEVYRADISAINITDTRTIDTIPIGIGLFVIAPPDANLDMKALQALFDPLSSQLASMDTSTLSSVPTSVKVATVSLLPLQNPPTDPQKLDSWISNLIPRFPDLGTEEGQINLVALINPASKSPSAVIGSRRQAWIEVSQFEKLKPLLPIFSTQVRHMLTNNVKSDNMRKQSYRFVFSLLNEDPSSTIASWNFTSLESKYLSRVHKTFSRVHDIVIESQVVHYTQLKREPLFDDQKKEFYLIPATLPHFVDGTEWKVDSGSDAKEKSLHFAVFVPSPSHSPLVIHHGGDSSSNAFTVTEWGGVVIQNLNSKQNLDSDSTSPKQWEMTPNSFKTALQVFVSQLRQHLGIPAFVPTLPSPVSTIDRITVLPALHRGAADWEIDILSRKQTWNMLRETQHTLTQFNLMMDQIANIPIHDHIQATLAFSLEEHAKAVQLLSIFPLNHDLAHTSASKALISAENVFFDKDMVGMLYFPSGHQVAIYLPLFLPLSFPLITGLKSELSHRRQKRAAASNSI